MRASIDPGFWTRLKPLFEEASELPPGEHARFLEERCGQDARLKEHLAALLAAHRQGGSMLDRNIPRRLCGLAADQPPAPAVAEEVQAHRSLSVALSDLALNRARTGGGPAPVRKLAEEALALNKRPSWTRRTPRSGTRPH